MKSTDLRSMAPPAAKANYGFVWIAAQGAVCALIAFGAYYVFSTPDLLGSGQKSSLAQQTIAVVARATAETPPPPAPPKAQPPPNPEQEAATSVMAFLGRTSPTDRMFAACSKQVNLDPSKLVQKFIQGDHDAIARTADCYLNLTPTRLCDPDQRQDLLDVLNIYFATKRAQIAAEKDRPGQPVVAAGRWESPIDRTVRARLHNAIAGGLVPAEEVAQARERELQAAAQDVKTTKNACQAGATAAAASDVSPPGATPQKPMKVQAKAPAAKKKKV